MILDTNAISALLVGDRALGAVLEAERRHHLPVVVIGENKTFLGAEDWMRQQGIELHVLNDERAIALMERLQRERADLWAEDIGE